MSDAPSGGDVSRNTQPIHAGAHRDTIAFRRPSQTAPFELPESGPAPHQLISGKGPLPIQGNKLIDMANANDGLQQLTSIQGFIGACLVDSNSGMMLGATGGNAEMNLELAAAGNTEVVRAKRAAMSMLKLNDQIEDILITLGRQYHLIRPVAAQDGLFIYLVLDRAKANLAMGRHALGDVEKSLTL